MDSNRWNFIQDEENEEEFGYEEKFGRDSIIFMIDCSEPMFMIKTEDGLSHFELSVKVALNLYNQKCLTNDRDYVGILFFNTSKTQNVHKFENIFVFHELGLPGAEKVKEIEKLLSGDVRKEFKENFGHADCKLDEALWACVTMFNNTGLREGTRRIFMFTDCDNPHKNDLDRQKRVHQKIQDLKEQSVQIELLPVGREDFNWDNFYNRALYDDDTTTKPNPADRFDELLDRALRKQYKKRAMATIPFSLGPDLELSVSLFNMIAPARIPQPVNLSKKSNEEIKTVRTFLDVETGEKLLPVDLKKYQTYGGEKIALEPDEVEQLRKLYPPGLALIGFQRKTFLKPYYHIKPCLFAYPNEFSVKGSSALFRCLLERCAEKDMVIICRLTPRSNMAPRLVALLPQMEQLDAKGFQEEPPGFQVVFLPYADDVRDLTKIEKLSRQAPEKDYVEKAKEIVSKLTIDYDPDTILNPALQTHYKAIEAFALEREEAEEIVDHTKPNIDWISRKAAQAVLEFKDVVYPKDYEIGGTTAKKRGLKSADAESNATKKGKPDAPLLNLEEEAKAGKLGNLTVATLRDLCHQHDIKLTGHRKNDIIEKINQHFGI